MVEQFQCDTIFIAPMSNPWLPQHWCRSYCLWGVKNVGGRGLWGIREELDFTPKNLYPRTLVSFYSPLPPTLHHFTSSSIPPFSCIVYPPITPYFWVNFTLKNPPNWCTSFERNWIKVPVLPHLILHLFWNKMSTRAPFHFLLASNHETYWLFLKFSKEILIPL